jgi:hypothetical protein
MNEQIKQEMIELIRDMENMYSAAMKGNVPVWHDANSNVVKTAPYTMSDNALTDLAGLMQSARMILVRQGVDINETYVDDVVDWEDEYEEEEWN